MTRSTAHLDALHSITQGAHRFKEILGPAPYCATESQRKLPLPLPLTIPLPQPITPLLISRGLDLSTAEQLNRAYIDKASSLKQVYERKHQQVVEQCLDIGAFRMHDMDQFISATHSTYIYLYNKSLQDWQVKIDEAARGHTSPVRKSSFYTNDKFAEVRVAPEKRPTFKNDTVPLLETAFNENAYPSRADKENLAAVTGMEFKQINIWFQNRRARSKREGVSPRRTATFATQMHTPMSSTVSPSPEPRFADASEERRLEFISEENIAPAYDVTVNSLTVTVTPSHAFPTPFPPPCVEDPFPVRSGTGLFQTPWLRKHSVVSTQRSPTNIEQLTMQMERLSLSDGTLSRYTSMLPSFTLTLPRAPLPALIRTVTTLSCARPVATLVSASPHPTSMASNASQKVPRAIPARLPHLSAERQLNSHWKSSSATRPLPIPYSPATRRYATRSPLHSLRSSSLSSITSSRSTSSSWSVASSMSPLTPMSTSPQLEVLAFIKDTSPEPSQCVYQSSSIDGIHIPSSPS